MNHLQNLEKAARLVDDADMLLIITGAGMGVDSGLPDFRGNQGFWNAYPALGRDRIDFYSMASPRSFREQPALAWGFYGHRLKMYRETRPHPGYGLLRKWGGNCPYGSMSFTTNVDEENCLLMNKPPRCPHCEGLARPNILMFGDAQWVEHRTQAQHDRLQNWLANAERLLVIEIGAGTAVSTARDLSHQIAFHLRAPVIRINPRDAGIHGHPGHVSLPMGGLQALKQIDALLTGQHSSLLD